MLDHWLYCPRCAAPLARVESRVECGACGFVSWANSVPGAQALIEEDGRVLLGRRAYDPAGGLWDIPGGFLEEGEHPLDGLRRELLEETGLETEPVEFLGIWMEPYWHRSVLCLTWIARRVSGTPQAGDDLVELRWFGRDELPGPEQLAFASFDEILSLWRARGH